MLLSVVVPKVTAQNTKMSAEFDTVTCRSLKVVDASGKVCAILEKKTRNATVDDVIRVLNRAGIPVYSVGVGIDGGMVALYDKSGICGVTIYTSPNGGTVCANNKSGNISAVMSGGTASLEPAVMVCDKNGVMRAGIFVHSNEGLIQLFDSDHKARVVITEDGNGGSVQVRNNNGKPSAGMCVDEYGNGFVGTWDKNGYRLR